MFKTILLLVFVLMISDVFSQDDKRDIKVEEFKAAINKQFTKITTGTSFSNLGNFASVSSDAKSLAIAGNVITKKYSVWGFELSGGATEGIFKIFNNEELNSNFAGEIKFHKLIKKGQASRNYFNTVEAEEQIDDLHRQFEKDSLSIHMQKDIPKLRLDIINTENKLQEITSHQFKVDSILNRGGIASRTADSLKAVRDILLFESKNNELILVDLKRKIDKITSRGTDYFDDELERKQQVKDKKLSELEKKKSEIELFDFDISWVSFGLKVKNNDIKLFTPANLPPAQFSDTSFVSQRLTVSYSRYKSNVLQKGDVYWSVGAYLDYTTNFNTLKKVEIEERIPVTGNPQQEIKKTINAYQGDYEEGIVDFTLFFDYYKFFGHFNTILGLHFNPVFNYSETIKKPLTNLQIGIVVPFGDKEKQTSKINVEVFYDRRDVFNYLNKNIKTSSIGVRATLPVTFLNNKI